MQLSYSFRLTCSVSNAVKEVFYSYIPTYILICYLYHHSSLLSHFTLSQRSSLFGISPWMLPPLPVLLGRNSSLVVVYCHMAMASCFLCHVCSSHAWVSQPLILVLSGTQCPCFKNPCTVGLSQCPPRIRCLPKNL